MKHSFFVFFLAFLMFVFRILNSPLLFLKLIFQSWIFVIDFYSFFGFLTEKYLKMVNSDSKLTIFGPKLTIFDQKLVKLNNTWNPSLLSFDNFSCFNKVELIRLISVFEFCSSRVAAASVWPKILENILKILLVKENIGQMTCEILQRENNVSLYLYLTNEWPPEWWMKYDSYDFSDGARDVPVKYGPIAPPSSKVSQVQPLSAIKKVWLSWDSNPRPSEVNLVHLLMMGHVTNLIKAALLVCSFPLALSFEIIWLYFCWCFKLKITNQNTGFKTDQSDTGTNLISRNFFVYSILAWARSVKNFPSLKKIITSDSVPIFTRLRPFIWTEKSPDR